MQRKNKIDIFLVEDDKLFLLALKSSIEAAFSNMNIKIHSFYTGESCMLKFTQVMPGIVILDYFLNGKYPVAADGVKVLDWIKRENQETSVIMLTGNDHLEVALESFHHGASDYVVKTETKFKKINYSLSNIFKINEAKRDARKYKMMALALSLCVSFLLGAVIAVQLYSASLLK